MLHLHNINSFYGEIQVLREISLHVQRGEIVAIVGANAAGKSTILKSISGTVLKVEGKIEFQGNDLTGIPAHQRTEMGLIHVPEGRRLFPTMTVQENLEMGAYAKRARLDRQKTLDQIYEMLPRLQERKKQQAGSLSGGEQQMVAIGRGLMAKPELLMLDEPTLGLAPIMVQWVFDFIRQIRDSGVTILIVEQNATKALEVADRGYVLENGQIVLEGTGQELLNNQALRKAYLGA
ncbi:ABC transporter ATP-binding protein [Thermoflavimicrobium dichotomicum]|uniref:Branched-chain amino acid transport system ATP-binding protein n=1 Tax=Thermoflavimicrobium dichotomicum TaxID=46223 RepID=A0A1I3S964_9BACL|nr:ABC transporter ATP-binding protein [Thermoflavimicrobium dichotomicum]SFJ55248.1 branched-chain amino acid transport system ATP-binding protein [Thermoflavimicrobium dichotomicum]